MNKRICLDVDGVICDIAQGIERGLEKIDEKGYDYSGWLTSYSNDPLMKEVMDNYLFWINLKPIKDSWHKVNAWWNSGYEVHFVTSRYSENSKTALPNWLFYWNIGYTSLNFATMGNKSETIKNLDGLFMVDDNPHEIEITTKENIPSFLMKGWYNSSHWNSMKCIDSLREIDLSQFERS